MVKDRKAKSESQPELKLNFQRVSDIMEQEKTQPTRTILKTETFVDELLGGGIETGQTIAVIGEFGTGKTQLLYSLLCTLPGQKLLIDCEGTFRASRLYEVAQNRSKISGTDPEKVVNETVHVRALSTDEQIAAFQQAIKWETKPDVIMVDGLITLFREEFSGGRAELSPRQQKLNHFIHMLNDYSWRNNKVVIVTNQVCSNPDSTVLYPQPEERNKPAGGNIFGHGINNQIYLRKVAGSKNKRIAIITDSSYIPRLETSFVITANGVEKPPKKAEEKTERGAEEETKEGEA